MYNTIRGWRDDGEKRGLCWYPNLNYRQKFNKKIFDNQSQCMWFYYLLVFSTGMNFRE